MIQSNSLRVNRLGLRCQVVLLATTIFSLAGCNLCCPPYLDDYATVGGKWARAHPSDGRVGSAFSDPGIIPAADQVSHGSIVVDQTVDQPMYEPTDNIEPLAEDAPLILGEDQ